MALSYSINSLFIALIACLSQPSAKESTFVITSECASPGDTLTLDCSVRLFQGGSSIVWRGTAFDCPVAKNQILILHRDFTNNGSITRTCNNDSIVASNLGIDSDNRTYISRLSVTVSSDLVGKNITCEYDNGTVPSPGSVKLIKTENGFCLNINYVVEDYERRIIFTWNQLCVAISESDCYTYILASNCGSCPTATNHTTVTCTDVPTEADYCVFTILYGSSQRNTTVDVELRQKKGSKPTGVISAYVLLTITMVILLTLVSIALMFRFRGDIKKIVHPFLHCHRSVSSTNTNNQPKDVPTNGTENEEDNIYNHLHENQEINDRVVKTFNNVESGVYGGLDDAGCQHKVNDAACSSGVKFQSSNGTLASAIYSQVGAGKCLAPDPVLWMKTAEFSKSRLDILLHQAIHTDKEYHM